MIENMTHEKWETITEVLDLLDLHRDNTESVLENRLERGSQGKVNVMLEGKIEGLNSLRASLVNKYRR